MIKSINEKEYNVIKSMLKSFYKFFINYKNTFIAPIYGCYKLEMTGDDGIDPLFFVLMKNILKIKKSDLPPGSRILCFDLKGSEAGRQSLKNCFKIFNPAFDNEVENLTLKDIDFKNTFKKIEIPRIQTDEIIIQMQKDTMLLREWNLIDYSLLLFIVDIPVLMKDDAMIKENLHQNKDSPFEYNEQKNDEKLENKHDNINANSKLHPLNMINECKSEINPFNISNNAKLKVAEKSDIVGNSKISENSDESNEDFQNLYQVE